MKCVRKSCSEEATFDAPEHLCEYHWIKWFCNGWSTKGTIDSVKYAWRKNGRPKNWKEILKRLQKNDIKKGQFIYYHWSASEVMRVKFVRWCRMRMCTGQDDTNKIGVGAIVQHQHIYLSTGTVITHDYGLKSGFFRLRPYWKLYRTYRSAYRHKNEIKNRPLPDELRSEDSILYRRKR